MDALATFSGGCFWCMVAPFEQLKGVSNIVSGYAGGDIENPSYEQVCSGTTGHVEAVQVTFNAEITSYQEILDTFWQQIDPTDAGGSFYDRGSHYRSVIFYHSPEQKLIATNSKVALEASQRFDQPIMTEVIAFKNFYPAEAYHQGYHLKNPTHYSRYRLGSGRDEFIAKNWTKKDS
jgi:peptide methionine sulfoxide reductase msrA/msrB